MILIKMIIMTIWLFLKITKMIINSSNKNSNNNTDIIIIIIIIIAALSSCCSCHRFSLVITFGNSVIDPKSLLSNLSTRPVNRLKIECLYSGLRRELMKRQSLLQYLNKQHCIYKIDLLPYVKYLKTHTTEYTKITVFLTCFCKGFVKVLRTGDKIFL